MIITYFLRFAIKFVVSITVTTSDFVFVVLLTVTLKILSTPPSRTYTYSSYASIPATNILTLITTITTTYALGSLGACNAMRSRTVKNTL